MWRPAYSHECNFQQIDSKTHTISHLHMKLIKTHKLFSVVDASLSSIMFCSSKNITLILYSNNWYDKFDFLLVSGGREIFDVF